MASNSQETIKQKVVVKVDKDKFPIKPIIFIIFLALLILFIGFFWNTFGRAGVELEVAGEKVSETGIFGVITSPFRNLRSWIAGTYGFQKPKTAEKQPAGIKITKFAPSRSVFEENQQVTLRADVKIDAMPKDDSIIMFSCGIEEVPGTIRLSGAEGETLFVEAGRSRITSVICEAEGLNSFNNELTTKKAKLSAEYQNFVTKSGLKIYTLSKDALMEFGTQDPFTKERIDEALLSKDRIMQPQCISGCGLTKISLKTSSQPLTNLGAYSLEIQIQKDQDWYGELSSLQGIRLSNYPKALTIKKCDQEISWENQEGDLGLLNKRLLNKEELIFGCEFEVTNPDNKLGENLDQFVVETTYNYLVDSSTSVKVKPPENNSITGSAILLGPLSEILQ